MALATPPAALLPPTGACTPRPPLSLKPAGFDWTDPGPAHSCAAQDCFLGLDWEKDPGTACCNEIVVKIELPGETMKELDLDVQKTKLIVQSKRQCASPRLLPRPRLRLRRLADRVCVVPAAAASCRYRYRTRAIQRTATRSSTQKSASCL